MAVTQRAGAGGLAGGSPASMGCRGAELLFPCLIAGHQRQQCSLSVAFRQPKLSQFDHRRNAAGQGLRLVTALNVDFA